jgi:sporulation protein YlmC with PRC-barrel domain
MSAYAVRRDGASEQPEDNMLKQLAYVGLISAALAASPGFAQTTNNSAPSSSSQPAAQPEKTDQSAAKAGASDTSGSFVTQQAMDQWRASKLVGVAVYGPDQKKVGSIKDILMDHDGNAQVIVMGVGGFLGIGAKDVAVPFKSMQWRTEGRAVATNPPGSSTSGTSGTGMTSAPATTKTNPQATEASQGYPDMGIINMTEAQLKAAPDFHYAQSPSSESASTTTPAAGGATSSEPPKKP